MPVARLLKTIYLFVRGLGLRPLHGPLQPCVQGSAR